MRTTPRPPAAPPAASVESLEPRSYYAVTVGPKVDLAVVNVSRSAVESLPAGSRDFARITLLSAGTAAAKGKVKIDLFASRDNRFDSRDRLLATSIRDVNVVSGSESILSKINYTYSSDMSPGRYRQIVRITPQFTDGRKGNNTFISQNTFAITAPLSKIDYSLAFASQPPSVIPFGVQNTVNLNLTNRGTVASTKPVKIGLYASTDNVFDASDIPLTTTTVNKRIDPKTTHRVLLAFTTPATFITGFYYIFARADIANAIAEINEANNFTVTKLRHHF